MLRAIDRAKAPESAKPDAEPLIAKGYRSRLSKEPDLDTASSLLAEIEDLIGALDDVQHEYQEYIDGKVVDDAELVPDAA